MQNTPGAFDYNIPQPRFGVTYTVNPNTVLRASYGRYNEQPSAAYEQYNALQQNLPDTLAQFYPLGFTTPGHEVAPSVSYNSDFSLEQHLPGTDMSFKLTPFLRQTQAQDRELLHQLYDRTGLGTQRRISDLARFRVSVR